MHNSQEGFTVTLALIGFCALGALSALVPVLAVFLLVLLGLAVLGGLGILARAWWTTRPEPLPNQTNPSVTPPACVAVIQASTQEVA